MTIAIRPWRLEDARACAEIMATSPPWDRYGVTLDSAEALFHSPQRRGARLRVATLHDQVAGFIWFLVRGAFWHSGYVRLIGVASACRGLGVGEALMQSAERELAAHVGSVMLLVSDFNGSAQRFYERMGYRKVGEVEDYVVPGITEYIYYRRLDPS